MKRSIEALLDPQLPQKTADIENSCVEAKLWVKECNPTLYTRKSTRIETAEEISLL